ncbi:Saccharopine dehydrogenase-domain-containing protein [Penicillium riverlandense]|uniref:Saccharopine dehydrogenase-domain-containing protein n=1 Tax=Penicillium riverlandense TaxID=1903569 RepID=UPI002547E022|nr:Saccharopine dehydrogenase-domain-containing protein [Penicillium riverlandense]KAJ5815341.1 Saccharopine dehydrogenase-domain-containing protein [Penicillium riverlandense]
MDNGSKGSKPVIFIGAADKICGEAIKLVVKATDIPIVLADSDEAALREFAAQLPRTVTTRKVDLFNPEELRRAISDAVLVVQGAQPYHRTSSPVIEACIHVKVPYLDYSDDVKSTQESLALHDRAKKEGVPCYINCGLSPGMSNLMAVDVSKEFDTIDSLDICWLVSEEAGGLGREVLEHLMHITGGPCLTWADGKGVVHENWVEKNRLPIHAGGDDLVYESAHPEPVTLPRRLPNVNRIRNGGAFNPAPFNGFARGLGAAVNSGALSMDEAIDFLLSLQKPSSASWTETLGAITAQFRGGDITLNQLYQLASHGLSSLKPWNFAIWGMLEQVRNGECTAKEVFCYLVNSARGIKAPQRSGMMVRGVGTKNGHPAVVVKRVPNIGPESLLGGKMSTGIGAACAAFVLLVLDQGSQKRPGVYCPEDWADAEAFYKCLERIGCERNHIVESA